MSGIIMTASNAGIFGSLFSPTKQQKETHSSSAVKDQRKAHFICRMWSQTFKNNFSTTTIQKIRNSKICIFIFGKEFIFLINTLLNFQFIKESFIYLFFNHSFHKKTPTLIRNVAWAANQHMWPWSTKAVLSRWGIFVAIAKNTLYGSKLLIFLLCQKMFHEDILYISYSKYIKM